MMKRPAAARGRGGGRGGGRGQGGKGRGRGKMQQEVEVEDMEVENDMGSTVETTGKKTKKNGTVKTDKKTIKTGRVKKNGGKKNTKKVVGKFEKVKKMKGKKTLDVPPKVTKPKSAPLRIAGGAPKKTGKVEKVTRSTNANDAIDQETTIGHVFDFMNKIDFGLELDELKSNIRDMLPELNGFNLNIYWTTSRCGLKVMAGRATRDIASFSFNQCWGPPSYKLAVSIGMCLELVPWLPFVSVLFP